MLATTVQLAPASAQARDLILFAAASTADALDALIGDYTETTGVTVRTAYASSGALARQIDNRAPASLFLSANTAWIGWLEKRGRLAPNGKNVLMRNRLVLIEPKTGKTGQSRIPKFQNFPERLRKLHGRLAIADPDHVPAGTYARDALISLDLWDKFSSTAARAKDVRGALLLVERREAMLGIVYQTDAKHSKQVNIIGRFPETMHRPIEYGLAIVREQDSPAARQLYDFLKSRKARAYFVRYGFVAP